MNKRPLVATLAVTLLVVIVAGTYLALGARPNLGLDLQGGISAIYTPQLREGEPEPDDFEEIIDETIEVIRARIDSLGVAEPDISRSGTDVMVQLPGMDDPERVQEIIGRTAQLRFREVQEIVMPGAEGYDEGPDCLAPVDEREDLAEDEAGLVCGSDDEAVIDPVSGEMLPPKYRVGPAPLTGERIDNAFVSFGTGQQAFVVQLALDRAGADVFAELSGDIACRRDVGDPFALLAIVLDGVVESAPGMNPDVPCGIGITGGEASITVGGGTRAEQEQEANDLALVLRTGALPITLEPATFQTVSPTLGAESLRAGLFAGLIGLVLVGVWLLWFYRWLGLVALAGLGVFGVIVIATISLLGNIGFALTLAGVAGIIVSIGITADSSIIFFERIRDEVNLGKTVRTAVKKAFTSAFRTNLAGNTVTLAAAVILYFLAVGPVRGFALMLGMATILDLLILGLFTRPVVFLMGGGRLLNRKNIRAAPKEARPAQATGAAR